MADDEYEPDFDDDVVEPDDADTIEDQDDEPEVEKECESECEETDEDAEEFAEEDEEEVEILDPDEALGEEVISLCDTGDDVSEIHKIIKHREKMLASVEQEHRITKYELTAIIGFRAQQIAEGAPPYVSVKDGDDPIQIAIDEFDKGVIPLMIERPFPASKICRFKYETYRLGDLVNFMYYK